MGYMNTEDFQKLQAKLESIESADVEEGKYPKKKKKKKYESEVESIQVTEDEIDLEKHKVIQGMRKALVIFDQAIFRLQTLDRMDDASGIGDLQDQLVTMDKLVVDMNAVLDRAARVVPPK